MMVSAEDIKRLKTQIQIVESSLAIAVDSVNRAMEAMEDIRTVALKFDVRLEVYKLKMADKAAELAASEDPIKAAAELAASDDDDSPLPFESYLDNIETSQ